jgi:glycosyltransferase involved in cell wall biosynthesis
VPRRILLLITDLEIGGTPTVVRELAMRLSGPEAHVEVAVLKDLGPGGAYLRSRDFTVTPFEARDPLALPRVVRRLIRLIREHRIDTVVSFLIHANLAASLAVGRDVRLFQSIQTTQARPKWHWTAQALIASRARRIIVPSPSVAQVAAERSAIALDQFEVIPNAINPDDFPRSQVPSTPPSLYPIGFIGRLDPVKRIPDLIDAVMPLSDRASLDIYGAGPEHERIRRIGARTGCFTLHGEIASPARALSTMGLLVLPSEAEGFGLVLIEAMAAGVPVIATDVPGIRDVVRHEVNGLLVPAAAPADLTKAIERIIEDRALRERLIENGLRTVRENFIWDIVLPRYRRLLLS